MSDDAGYLLSIADSIERVERYTADGRDAFHADPMVQDAVLRNLEVIGEAVKQLSDEVRAQAPDVPWRQIAGMRDKLIHDYLGVDLELVWDTVENELQRLSEAVDRLSAKLSGS